MSEAFVDDPLLQIVAPNAATRRRWAPWFMGLPLRNGRRRGEAWDNEDVTAVAVCMPPGSGES